MRQRSERVDRPGTHVTMRFTWPFLLGPAVFFRTAVPCSGRYHLEWGGMSLHDAIGIKSKNCATTENQGADVEYMVLRGVC